MALQSQLLSGATLFPVEKQKNLMIGISEIC